jgi:hypothetical protein
MQSRESLYELLQVDSNASAVEIRRAFLRLAYECHPDIAADATAGDERFKKVRAAYEVLIDPQLRALYDLDPESIRHRFGPKSPIVTEPYQDRTSGQGFQPIWLADRARKSERSLFLACACIAALILIFVFRHIQKVQRSNYLQVAASKPAEKDGLEKEAVQPSVEKEQSVPAAAIETKPVPKPVAESKPPDVPTFDSKYSPFEGDNASLPMFPDGIAANPNERPAGTSVWSGGERHRAGSAEDSGQPLLAASASVGAAPVINYLNSTSRSSSTSGDRAWYPTAPVWQSSQFAAFGQFPSQAELVSRNTDVNMRLTASGYAPSSNSYLQGMYGSSRSGSVSRPLVAPLLRTLITPRPGVPGGRPLGMPGLTSPALRAPLMSLPAYPSTVPSRTFSR